jgi:anaerobic ribonucleoside-triphosphate reductase
MPYFTITPTFSICPKHGYISGEHYFCPKCDEEQGLVDNDMRESETIKIANKEKEKESNYDDIERNIINSMM